MFSLNLKNNETKILSKPDDIFTEPINNILALRQNIFYTKRNEFEMKSVSIKDSNRVYVFRPIIAKQVYALNNEQNVLADWNANVLRCDAFSTKVIDTLISFNDYRISVNAFLKQGNLLYIGTNKGLFQYDFKSKVSRHLIRPELNYNINDIVAIGKNIYVAHEAGITEVGGTKLIQECGKFRLNSVKKIKVYNDLIWLATLDGILVCNQQFDVVKTFNKASGLPSNSVNDITFAGDMLCVSTARGIAYSSIKNVLKYSAKLDPVTMRDITFKGDLILAKNNVYYFSNEMESVNISFVSTFFNKPNKQFFRWRNNGEAWTFIGNPAFDVSLSGGKHLLEISASNDNINWSEPSAINIVKEEKLSERQLWYWFLTLLSSGIIILISFILIRRVKLKAKRRLQDEQQVNLLKHQAMNALLSPHFIFNSLTSIQNYINTNNGLRASEYLAKFSRLIRMIIEKAALSEISLHDEITRLTYYLELEKERFKNKFDYSINLDENISTHQIMIPNMIIQPYVENSILHGILPKNEHGHLNINFKSIHAKKLQIVIEDNGIGLIKARELAKAGHKSIGTNTIQNILEVNSKLTGKKQYVTMVDKSTLDDTQNGTIITIEIEL
ncbi:MAG: histidine kinase [Bacteroidota bacterium]